MCIELKSYDEGDVGLSSGSGLDEFGGVGGRGRSECK